MPLTPVTVEKFGGLNLLGDPGEVGLSGAISLQNVDLPLDGSMIRVRDGSATHAVGLPGATYALQPAKFGTTPYLFVGGITSAGTMSFLASVNTGGGVVSIGTWALGFQGSTPTMLTPFGTPTGTYVYMSNSGQQIRRWDGTTLTTQSGSPGFVAVSPQSNRIVHAWFRVAADSPTGANGTNSTVFFSNPGSDAFSANNYVHLHPGDGEEITGMAVWNNLLYVFKQTRMFVFYGESTDGTGQPIFNYREVQLPEAIYTPTTDQRVIAGSLGVYFVTPSSLFRTTGGPPVLVSNNVRKVLRGGMLSAVNRKIYVQAGNGSNQHYVFDEQSSQWTMYSYAQNTIFGPLVSWPALSNTYNNPDTKVFATTNVYVTDTTFTTDSGSAIAAQYKTGVADLGSPDQKIMREIVVDGSGTVNVGVGVDWGAPPTPGDAITMVSQPSTSQGRARTAYRAKNFSVRFLTTSGAWAVNRFVLNMRSKRPTGPQSS